MWSKIGSDYIRNCHFRNRKKFKKLVCSHLRCFPSAGLDRFRKQKPDKYLDLGISEQNLIGVASGLSTEGFDVITTTFAPFQTLDAVNKLKSI